MIGGRPVQSERIIPCARPVVPPIHDSVTYFLDDIADKGIRGDGLDQIWYGRFRNPTVDAAAEEVTRLEGAEAAFMPRSGMVAIATALLTLLTRGEHVLSARQVHGHTLDQLVCDPPSRMARLERPLRTLAAVLACRDGVLSVRHPRRRGTSVPSWPSGCCATTATSHAPAAW